MLSEATRHIQLSYITRASLSTERHCNDKNYHYLDASVDLIFMNEWPQKTRLAADPVD